MTKTIITVLGKDAVGIIAKVCTYLAENNVNILDINQTIVSGYFNMMMVTDTSHAVKSVGDLADELEALGQSMHLSIRCMQEDIFDSMHRI
ncbi:MAG: ACT domain-containing protein [Lachnospiraceae bacterium]|nr:ACT domain-containing protein [Lachnospiraceae bacterium]